MRSIDPARGHHPHRHNMHANMKPIRSLYIFQERSVAYIYTIGGHRAALAENMQPLSSEGSDMNIKMELRCSGQIDIHTRSQNAVAIFQKSTGEP